jgi:hypothetical protein
VTRLRPLPASLLSVLFLAGLPACQRPGGQAPPSPPKTQPRTGPEGERAFRSGTSSQRDAVAKAVSDLESPDIKQRMEAANVLARVGEPAVPSLLDALRASPSTSARGMAAYTLGHMNDHRARDPLALALADPEREVQLEAATALLRLQDDRGFTRLVIGLEDADPRVRARSILVLHEAVGQTWGYAADDTPLDREDAVARWKGWLRERQERGR